MDEPARRRREGGFPVWTYRWDWDEQGRRLGLNVTQLLGAAHGLEIPFVFNHFDVGSQSGLLYHEGNAPGRERLARQMMGYWASFARNLDPGTGGGLGPRWLPFEERLAVGHLRLDTAPGPEMTSVAETLEGLARRSRRRSPPRFGRRALRRARQRVPLRRGRRAGNGTALARLRGLAPWLMQQAAIAPKLGAEKGHLIAEDPA